MGSFKLTERRVKLLELAGIRDVRQLWNVLGALNLKGSVEVEWDWGSTTNNTEPTQPAEPDKEKK